MPKLSRVYGLFQHANHLAKAIGKRHHLHFTFTFHLPTSRFYSMFCSLNGGELSTQRTNLTKWSQCIYTYCTSRHPDSDSHLLQTLTRLNFHNILLYVMSFPQGPLQTPLHLCSPGTLSTKRCLGTHSCFLVEAMHWPMAVRSVIWSSIHFAIKHFAET